MEIKSPKPDEKPNRAAARKRAEDMAREQWHRFDLTRKISRDEREDAEEQILKDLACERDLSDEREFDKAIRSLRSNPELRQVIRDLRKAVRDHNAKIGAAFIASLADMSIAERLRASVLRKGAYTKALAALRATNPKKAELVDLVEFVTGSQPSMKMPGAELFAQLEKYGRWTRRKEQRGKRRSSPSLACQTPLIPCDRSPQKQWPPTGSPSIILTSPS
jgi:hypothetical protein